MPDLALSTQRLGRRFGAHWALAHVDLEIAVGESLLVAGANGSGKTTLLRIASGLLRPSRGRIAVLGHDPRQARSWVRERLTLVSHHAYLYDGLTAQESLALWNRLLPRPRPAGELVDLLERVGLREHAHQTVAGFSAGMRKRLTLLRTALERPQLVLLDEPFAALDPEGQDMVERWLRDFRDQGTTVVMASHSLERATRSCTRALWLERGQIAWQGPAADLLARRQGES